tara:strand:- start:1604 stop:2290 length:687 start_codon:yes stop_codon:yes gene_type:complete
MQVSEAMVQAINTIHAAILSNTKLIGRAMRIATGNELRVNALCDANLIDKVESLTKEVESLKAENAKVKESKAEWVMLFNDAISEAISDLNRSCLDREDEIKDSIEKLDRRVTAVNKDPDIRYELMMKLDSLDDRVIKLSKLVDVIDGAATEAMTDARFAKDSGFNLRADLNKLEDKVNTLTGNVDGSLDALDFSVDLLKMEVRSLVNRESDKADRVSEILAQLDEEG